MPAPTALPATARSGTWDLVADAYSAQVAPHFEVFADAALDDAAVKAGEDVADVACGPGTLAVKAKARGAVVKAVDFSPAMVERAKTRGVDAVVGDGQALPWPDASFDAAFSLFGLMFFPDRAKGFAELLRVLRPGGRAVVSSWVETSEVPLLRDAISTLMTASRQPSPPPARPGLATADDCRREMSAAGFVDVVVEQRSVLVPFASPTALLEWMSSSAAPVRVLREAAGEAEWAEIFLRWKVAMMDAHGGMPVELPLVALLTRGSKR